MFFLNSILNSFVVECECCYEFFWCTVDNVALGDVDAAAVKRLQFFMLPFA